MIWISLRQRALIMLVMLAGGACCGFVYDILLFLGQFSPRKIVRGALDVLCVLICALILLLLWYRIDRLQIHYTTIFSAVLGFVLYRLGLGFFVRLCFEKCTNTRCCGHRKSAKKT